MAAKLRPTRGKGRRIKARTSIAATRRSAQGFPAVRREQRSAQTLYGPAGNTIWTEVPWRHGDWPGSNVRDTHIHIHLPEYALQVARLRLPARATLKTLPLSLGTNGDLVNNFRQILVIQRWAPNYSKYPYRQGAASSSCVNARAHVKGDQRRKLLISDTLPSR